MNTMKTNQIPEIYDLAEKHAKRYAEQRDTAQHVYCSDVKYQDGDTLSAEAVRSKPRETVCLLLEAIVARNEARAHAQRLAEALKALLYAFAPKVEYTVLYEGVEALQSDVKRARQALIDWEGTQQ